MGSRFDRHSILDMQDEVSRTRDLLPDCEGQNDASLRSVVSGVVSVDLESGASVRVMSDRHQRQDVWPCLNALHD